MVWGLIVFLSDLCHEFMKYALGMDFPKEPSPQSKRTHDDKYSEFPSIDCNISCSLNICQIVKTALQAPLEILAGDRPRQEDYGILKALLGSSVSSGFQARQDYIISKRKPS